MKALWKHKLIAESSDWIELEGNIYFPEHSVIQEYLRSSETITTCPWKGRAHYYDVVVDGEVDKDAAWYYPVPKTAASEIKNFIAFWHGVEVSD